MPIGHDLIATAASVRRVSWFQTVPVRGPTTGPLQSTRNHGRVTPQTSGETPARLCTTPRAWTRVSRCDTQPGTAWDRCVPAHQYRRGEFGPWTATIVKERYMIEYDLDTEHSILHVQPKSAIEQDDFVKLAKAVDPHIEATGGLAGLIIDTPSAPGHRGHWCR